MPITVSEHQHAGTIDAPQPPYTTIELHTASSLLRSPHLPALSSLINYAFNCHHDKDGQGFLPWDERTRLKTDAQLGEEVGLDGFILLMLEQPASSATQTTHISIQTKAAGFRSPAGERIIGTASAKPYTITDPTKEPGDAVHLHFKRPPPDSSSRTTNNDDDTPEWEILAMAVDPALQGRGLATQLMNLTVDEIKRRCGSNLQDPTARSQSSLISANDGIQDGTTNASEKKEVRLLLSTMAETNEEYYARRGWTATTTRAFPKGTLGSRVGFHVVEMFKRVEL